MKKFAFTLAETLIVMGIIGVVAALTLPNLNSSTGEKEKVAKVKKIYQNLEDAVGRAQAVYGPIDEWCLPYNVYCQPKYYERIAEFMKYSSKCDTVGKCVINKGDIETAGFNAQHGLILSDGTLIDIRSHGGTEIEFYIDIDGSNKGANRYGYDNFYFKFNKYGLVSYNYPNNKTIWYSSSSNFYSPLDSFVWIINFDNMDYLKTTDGTTCPDGKKLTFGGNHSCK